MKNIFQPGLAIGIPSGSCMCKNIDFSWLFENPTNLLWMDKLVVTQNVWNIIMSGDHVNGFAKGKEEALAKCVKLIYSILNDTGLVEIIPDNSISEETKDNIFRLIESDIDLLGSNVTEEDTLLKIGCHRHCVPSLWTLYAALYLSKNNNASFALTESEMDYLKTVLPLRVYGNNRIPLAKSSNVINDVLKISLPKFELGHGYLFDPIDHCNMCKHLSSCKDNYLKDIEKQTIAILEYREHEEIHQLCSLMEHICSDKFKENYDLDADELLREVNVERIKVQRKLNKSYRNYEKWKNIVMTISAGMTLSSFFNHPVVASIGASGVLASNIAGAILSQQEKKYRWVNLFNKS